MTAELTELVQVAAPHFVAGLVVRDWRVAETAPILAYMRGWDFARVEGYCLGKRWELKRVA